jgi:hypothetical protein
LLDAAAAIWPRVTTRLLLAGITLDSLGVWQVFDLVETELTAHLPAAAYGRWRTELHHTPVPGRATKAHPLPAAPRTKMTKAQYLAKAAAEMNRR